ncbi:MAG TPA: hypothetical protein VKI62_05095, partial [Bacteroidota bacterium]|nr:hypothetical protein [Bacteroidota bacterium]
MGLQQQTAPTLPQEVVNFSNPWSGKSLEFDVDSRNVVPSTFNVIDSAQLVDRLGGVNVLIATVPLLHSSPESSIYTESAKKPWTDELNLLNHLLCSEPTFMCNLLGVAPLAYLTGTSTRGLLQDSAILFDVSGNLPAPLVTSIVWKRPTSGDSKVTDPMKVSFDDNNFSSLLINIYDSMFANPNENTVSKEFRDEYTHAGFAALLAFVKQRVYVDWEIALAQFCTNFKAKYSGEERHFTDLLWNVYFFGVLSQPPSTALWRNISQDVFPVGNHGEDRSEIQCILLTVPRRCLQP